MGSEGEYWWMVYLAAGKWTEGNQSSLDLYSTERERDRKVLPEISVANVGSNL